MSLKRQLAWLAGQAGFVRCVCCGGWTPAPGPSPRSPSDEEIDRAIEEELERLVELRLARLRAGGDEP